MANQTGIAITITAFLPTGKTLDQQFEALSIVKKAHETGDYAHLLQASVDVLVKTENKTRRVEAAIAAPPAHTKPTHDQAEPAPTDKPDLVPDEPKQPEPAGQSEDELAALDAARAETFRSPKKTREAAVA